MRHIKSANCVTIILAREKFKSRILKFANNVENIFQAIIDYVFIMPRVINNLDTKLITLNNSSVKVSATFSTRNMNRKSDIYESVKQRKI